MIEADLVKIRGALEKETLKEACHEMERVLGELGYHKTDVKKSHHKDV